MFEICKFGNLINPEIILEFTGKPLENAELTKNNLSYRKKKSSLCR